MSYTEAIFLGILQGLTEFLPVSSSGHLVLAEHLMGVKRSGVDFEVIVHLGTVLSVLVYFRARIFDLISSLWTRDAIDDRKIWLYITIATIPAGLVGFFWGEEMEFAFSEPFYTSVALICTSAILFVSRFFKNESKSVNFWISLAMGFGQVLAIFPGISRSGSTIVAGMIGRGSAAKVAEFSFLMAIPVIGGAAALKLPELFAVPSVLIGPYLAGALMSFVTGLLAVYALLSVVRKGKFEYFAFYTLALGLVGLYLF